MRQKHLWLIGLLFFSVSMIVLGVVLLRELSAPRTVKATASPGPTSDQPLTVEAEPSRPLSLAVQKVRDLAVQKNVHWEIYCMPRYENEAQQFAAWAAPAGMRMGQFYIEDGGQPHWYNDSFKSEDDAAKWLAKALTGAPNSIPDHKPVDKRIKVECGSIAGDEKGNISY